MWDWSLLLRVLLAAGLSAAIGIEREFHGRPAGLRTHLLVGAGAATVIVAFFAVWTSVADGQAAPLPQEIGRLAAGVITGIGFLGAGTIIKVGDWVRGLTTAASLWFVATLGIAAGLGAYAIAIGGGVVGLAILAVVDPIASRIPSRVYQTLTLTVDAARQKDVQAELQTCCVEERMQVTLVSWEWDSTRSMVTLTYRIKLRGAPALQRLAERASELRGVVETHVNL
jgi:putative Mg2+ transporter-C (MgtC) family protein